MKRTLRPLPSLLLVFVCLALPDSHAPALAGAAGGVGDAAPTTRADSDSDGVEDPRAEGAQSGSRAADEGTNPAQEPLAGTNFGTVISCAGNAPCVQVGDDTTWTYNFGLQDVAIVTTNGGPRVVGLHLRSTQHAEVSGLRVVNNVPCAAGGNNGSGIVVTGGATTATTRPSTGSSRLSCRTTSAG